MQDDDRGCCILNDGVGGAICIAVGPEWKEYVNQ
jgi:hypothetical protein